MDFKGFMQKMKPSSSGKFKGQGRVLGSGPSSSSSGPSSGSVYVNPNRNPNPNHPSISSDPNPLPEKSQKTSLPSNPKTPPEKTLSEDPKALKPTPNRENLSSNSDGFDPFDSLITSGKRNKNGYSLKVFECPICNSGFASEEEVSFHIESCIENPRNENPGELEPDPVQARPEPEEQTDRLETCVGTYLSGDPSEGSVEIVLRLLRNIVKEPDNVKFRKIRMGNPKIREAIGDVPGGIELVECVGFGLREEGGEMWAVMDDDRVKNAVVTVQKAIRLLEARKTAQPQKITQVESGREIESESRKIAEIKETAESEPKQITEPEKTEPEPEKTGSEPKKVEPEKTGSEPKKVELEKTGSEPEKVDPEKTGSGREKVDPEKTGSKQEKVETEKVDPEKTGSEREKVDPAKVDRETRVFFAMSESAAARINLPESFYTLSPEEARREAEARRKKIADSQLLIPKSYKEKQAQAARKKYTRAVIRVQFPDGVVLQGVFRPDEPTSALYEFVGSALKQPGLEFELVRPVPARRRVILCFPEKMGEKWPTLVEEDLVPSALVKFKPMETDEVVFVGLRNELLQMSEPLG